VRAWAFVEIGDSQAIDVFLREDDANRALDDCLCDEPDWRDILRVVEVEFTEGAAASAN
jgi:hypothetical protein